jgi:hypothetical protein
LKDKILITGFPHTGTSILKSKFGECNNIFEYPYELDYLRDIELASKKNNEFALIKTPSIPIEIKKYGLGALPNSIYKDYIIILVTRNPWNLFTSIYKSGEDPLKNDTYHLNPAHTFRIEEYIISCKLFLDAAIGNYPNVYAIRYEDFFINNFEPIKKIMNDIGLKYNDDLFIKRTKDYVGFHGYDINTIDTTNLNYKNRAAIRTWQINQPFENMNSDVNIPDELSDILKNSNIIQELGYSDPRITG